MMSIGRNSVPTQFARVAERAVALVLAAWSHLVQLTPRRWERRRTWERFPAALAQLSRTASQLVSGTEPGFLRLGRDLTDFHAGCIALGQESESRIASLRDALRDNRMQCGMGIDSELLEAFRLGLAESQEEMKSLNATCAAIRKLIPLGRQFSMFAIFLKASGYSFRTESARSDETRAAFGEFSDDVAKLAGRIGELGDEIEAKAAEGYRELTALTDRLTRGLGELESIAETAGAVLSRACRDTQELTDSAIATLEDCRRRIAAVVQHSAKATFHIQFGDIARQKTEHIAAALREASELAASDANAAPRLDRLLAVQEGQIAVILKELDAARHGIDEAFTGFEREGAHLAAEMVSLRKGRGVRDPFEDLKLRLSEVQALKAKGDALRRQCGDSWRRSVEAAAEIASRVEEVREINFRMHLQSLNAIVRTEWLGEDGRTLAVLSGNMNRMFRDSRELAGEISAVLDALALRTENTGQEAAAFADTDSLGVISRSQEQFARMTRSPDRLAASQAAQRERAKNSLRFLAESEARLANLAESIAGQRRALAPFVSAAEATAAAEPSAVAADLYTMESEREVYRSLTAVAGAGADAAHGDNVEFF